MTATRPKTKTAPEGKVYRAKVTGRHAITLPAELCQALDIQVGDYLELELKGEEVTMRPLPPMPISSLRGILKPYFPNATTETILAYLEEEREGLDEREAELDKIWDRKWQSETRSND